MSRPSGSVQEYDDDHLYENDQEASDTHSNGLPMLGGGDDVERYIPQLNTVVEVEEPPESLPNTPSISHNGLMGALAESRTPVRILHNRALSLMQARQRQYYRSLQPDETGVVANAQSSRTPAIEKIEEEAEQGDVGQEEAAEEPIAPKLLVWVKVPRPPVSSERSSVEKAMCSVVDFVSRGMSVYLVSQLNIRDKYKRVHFMPRTYANVQKDILACMQHKDNSYYDSRESQYLDFLDKRYQHHQVHQNALEMLVIWSSKCLNNLVISQDWDYLMTAYAIAPFHYDDIEKNYIEYVIRSEQPADEQEELPLPDEIVDKLVADFSDYLYCQRDIRSLPAAHNYHQQLGMMEKLLYGAWQKSPNFSYDYVKGDEARKSFADYEKSINLKDIPNVIYRKSIAMAFEILRNSYDKVIMFDALTMQAKWASSDGMDMSYLNMVFPTLEKIEH